MFKSIIVTYVYVFFIDVLFAHLPTKVDFTPKLFQCPLSALLALLASSSTTNIKMCRKSELKNS